MPLPIPNTGESEQDFVSRCMSAIEGEYPDEKQRAAVCYAQFRKDAAAEVPQLYRIAGVPIFEAGEWKGGALKYPQERLEQIVESAQELKERIVPYVFLGHTGPEGTRKRAGEPAVGHLENIRLAGKRIVADLAAIPKQVYELIRNGGYRRVSAEIARDWMDTITGKKHDRLLTGLALLGAEHPAVNTLPTTIADYSALYYQDDMKLEFETFDADIKVSDGDAESEIVVRVSKVEHVEGGEQNMADKIDYEADKKAAELQARLDKAKAELDAAQEANVKLASEKQAEVDALKEEIDKRDKAERGKKIADFLSEQKASGKLLPVQEDIYRDRLESAKDVDAELSRMREMFKEMPKLVDLDRATGVDEEHFTAGDETSRDRAKQALKMELVANGFRIPEADEVEDFAEAFSAHKPGERAVNMGKTREKLADELKHFARKVF